MLVSLPVRRSVHGHERARSKCPLVWISPVSQNYQGPRTAYGDPYHGYWIADASQLNSRFGTADDLKALSAELHRRGMSVTNAYDASLFSPYFFRYLMVDTVVNNVMATSVTPDYSTYMLKEPVTLVAPYPGVSNDTLFKGPISSLLQDRLDEPDQHSKLLAR